VSDDALLRSEIPGIPVRHGKVRDVYDFGDKLLLVATDRISAFDWILPTAIPDKGRVLTRISEFWFDRLDVKHHLLSTDLSTLPIPASVDLDALEGRSMITQKADVFPVECVVRGYLAGSGWKEYQQSQTVCGIELPSGLVLGSQLPEPIFTPATKAEEGHDENISFQTMCDIVGTDYAKQLRNLSHSIYSQGSGYAAGNGIIIADTKFEFGLVHGEIILIDEVLTPDSSRFWPAEQYLPGQAQPSFDKQFVRDWLESTDWNKNSSPPELPDDIVSKTREKYVSAYEQLAQQPFSW